MVLLFCKGLATISGLFAVCFFAVIGAKWCVNYLKKIFAPPPQPVRVERKRKRKTYKSLEIDPTSVDRIFFKKSS